MEAKIVGKGSQYPWTSLDSKGERLDGSKAYRLRFLPNIPVADSSSLIVYDTQTRSKPQTDQAAPSVSSQTNGIKTNADGFVDAGFGQKPPVGFEKSWVQTIPGMVWFTFLRHYGLLEPCFNQSWRPGQIELQK